MSEQDDRGQPRMSSFIVNEISNSRLYQSLIIITITFVFMTLGFLIGWVVHVQVAQKQNCIQGITCVGGTCNGERCEVSTKDDCPEWPRGGFCKHGGIIQCNNAGEPICECIGGYFGDRCEFSNPCDPEVNGFQACGDNEICLPTVLFSDVTKEVSIEHRCIASHTDKWTIIRIIAPFVMIIFLWIYSMTRSANAKLKAARPTVPNAQQNP